MTHSLYQELQVFKRLVDHDASTEQLVNAVKRMEHHCGRIVDTNKQFSAETRAIPLIQQSLKAIHADLRRGQHEGLKELTHSMDELLVQTNKDLQFRLKKEKDVLRDLKDLEREIA